MSGGWRNPKGFRQLFFGGNKTPEERPNLPEPGTNALSASDERDMTTDTPLSREAMIALLNEDLAREYQAIIAYVIYSKTIKGARFTDIARELAVHAGEELNHALLIAEQIDYLNGTPIAVPKEVKISSDPEEMLRFDLENERVTINHYRDRIRQAEAMGEFAMSEVLRRIIVQEQEHLTDLASALGIDNPELGNR